MTREGFQKCVEKDGEYVKAVLNYIVNLLRYECYLLENNPV